MSFTVGTPSEHPERQRIRAVDDPEFFTGAAVPATRSC
jgi:hypothetical protein